MEGKDPLIDKNITKHSFMELAEEYSKWTKRQKSYRCKQVFIGQLMNAFGNCQINKVSTKLVEEWQSERMQYNKPATVNRLLATLKHMFTKAVEWEMVSEEVLKKIRKVKLLSENNRRLRYLSKEECQTLINACGSYYLKAVVITALNTGMRKEKILSLEWDKNVDLKHGFVLLDQTKNGERREIPINQTLGKTLQSLPRRLDSNYVFAHNDGERFYELRKSFHAALKKAGIEDFRFHDLRHTFASHLVMSGIDITTVKELLGHKTISMTLRYAHLAPAHKVNALSILDSNMNKKPTIQKLYNFEKETVSV